jgi:hypothetical protein
LALQPDLPSEALPPLPYSSLHFDDGGGARYYPHQNTNHRTILLPNSVLLQDTKPNLIAVRWEIFPRSKIGEVIEAPNGNCRGMSYFKSRQSWMGISYNYRINKWNEEFNKISQLNQDALQLKNGQHFGTT